MSQAGKTGAGALRRALSRAGTIAATAAILAVAAGLVAGGRIVLAERAADVPAPAPAAAMAVEAVPVVFEEGFTVERRFGGQIEAPQSAELGFETGGTVAEVLVDEGDSVAPGAPLARLDTRLLEAEKARLEASRRAMEAQVELARRTAERQRELNARGFSADQLRDNAELALAEGRARLAELDAALLGVEVQLEKAVLTARFAGTVSRRHLDPGVSVAAGRPVLTVVQSGAPRFRAGIAPALAQGLVPGDRFDVVLAGVVYPARLASVLPELDPVTRTRTLVLDLPEGAPRQANAVGELVLRERVRDRGAWVPIAALLDGPRGLWSVRTVSEAGVVGGEAVEVLHVEAERAFVRGTLAPGMMVVTDGPHRVVEGQAVILAGTPG